MEAHAATVLEDRGRERVHLAVLEPGLPQRQLVQDAGHVDDVVRHRMGVEAVSGDRLFAPRAAAGGL